MKTITVCKPRWIYSSLVFHTFDFQSTINLKYRLHVRIQCKFYPTSSQNIFSQLAYDYLDDLWTLFQLQTSCLADWDATVIINSERMRQSSPILRNYPDIRRDRLWTEFNWLRILTGFCEHGNELSGTIKEHFLTSWAVIIFSRRTSPRI
jgi:hypothetical protein